MGTRVYKVILSRVIGVSLLAVSLTGQENGDPNTKPWGYLGLLTLNPRPANTEVWGSGVWGLWLGGWRLRGVC